MAADHGLGDRLYGVGIAVISAGLIVRSARVCIIVSAVGVELRTPWRTHRLALEEIASARLVPMNTLGLFSTVCVVPGRGRRIRVDGVGSWRATGDPSLTEVERVVSEINRRIGIQSRSVDTHIA